MDSVGGGRDAEEGRGDVEGHAIDGARYRSATKLIKLLTLRDRKDADDGALLGSRGEERAGRVEGDGRERRLVGFDDIDGFQGDGVVDEDLPGRGSHIGRGWGRMGGSLVGRVLARLGEGVGNVAVLRGGREGADCAGVRGCGYGFEKFHVRDVVEVYLFLQNHGKTFPVEAHREDGGGEGKLAYDGRPLRDVSAPRPPWRTDVVFSAPEAITRGLPLYFG